jgi:hypothetical protein
LFISGIFFLLDAVSAAWPRRRLIEIYPVTAALSCLATAVPTLSRRLPSVWKCFFGTLVLLDAGILLIAAVDATKTVPALNDLTRAVGRVRLGVAATLPFVLSAWQLRFGDRMSWMHWLGVGMFSLWMASALIFALT